MNGKKARLIRQTFKEAGHDVFADADYRISKKTDKNALIDGKLTTVTRHCIVNKTKNGYRRAKKDLVRGVVKL